MQPELKVNVLMVDDHSENLLALEAVLAPLGENLVRANSGEEALKCILNQDFAVILLDVQMPRMDGFETATLIRERDRSRDTPIIFLTAFSTSDSLVFKGYSLGAVDYLIKPVVPEILISKVSVFVDLFKKTTEVKRQANQLAIVNAQLSKSEQQFRSLSASSPVGIFMTDVKGNCTYMNPRCQSILGFDVGTLEADWLQSVHPDDQNSVKTDWSNSIYEGQEYSNELRLLLNEGVVNWVHVRSSPMISDRGELLGYVGTIEDITQRKQAEEERNKLIREQAARQEAERANRMKDEFLATLSHELRTPLNSILGWTRLLRTRKFDADTIKRVLETIERNSKLQAQMIEEILDISRIIQGKLNLQLHPVNLMATIRAALDTLGPVAEAKGVCLQSTMPPSVDWVLGDSARLQQIVTNLLSNAIKFTPSGGCVDIELFTIASNGEEANVSIDDSPLVLKNYAQIRVTDTGVGINKNFLPFVFDRFRQADSTTTRLHGGLGLGLAIVDHLVKLHGGTVHADSQGEGQGATFTVNLPIFQSKKGQIIRSTKKENLTTAATIPPAVPHPTSPYASPDLIDLRLLVVDDDADTRDLLNVVLTECGAQVETVGSVNEALETIEQLQPDLLVSDIGLPGEDGYTLIRKVRNLSSQFGQKLPAIALTAHAREEDSTLAISEGFQMHISKPVDLAQLIAAIVQLTRKNGYKP